MMEESELKITVYNTVTTQSVSATLKAMWHKGSEKRHY